MHYRVFIVFPLLSGMTQALVRRYPAGSVYSSMASSASGAMASSVAFGNVTFSTGSGAVPSSAASGAMASSAASGAMASSVASEVMSAPVVSGAMSTSLSGAIPTSDFVYTSMAYTSLPSTTV